MIRPRAGSMVKVKGSMSATPLTALRPGKAPMMVPTTVPTATTKSMDGCRLTTTAGKDVIPHAVSLVSMLQPAPPAYLARLYFSTRACMSRVICIDRLPGLGRVPIPGGLADLVHFRLELRSVDDLLAHLAPVSDDLAGKPRRTAYGAVSLGKDVVAEFLERRDFGELRVALVGGDGQRAKLALLRHGVQGAFPPSRPSCRRGLPGAPERHP